MSQLTIRDIRARAVEVPIARPVRTASGEIEKAPLLLIDVLTDQGITGCAYAFGYTRATLRPLLALAAELRTIDYTLIGAAIFHVTMVVTVALGCLIVMIMKGPQYTSDSYPVQDAERPSR